MGHLGVICGLLLDIDFVGNEDTTVGGIGDDDEEVLGNLEGEFFVWNAFPYEEMVWYLLKPLWLDYSTDLNLVVWDILSYLFEDVFKDLEVLVRWVIDVGSDRIYEIF